MLSDIGLYYMALHGIKPSCIAWYSMELHPNAAFFGYFTQARKLNLWWWEEPGLNVFETVFQEICKFHWRSRSNLNIFTLWSFQTFFIIQSQSCNCEKCTVHKFPLYQREILYKISLGQINGLNVVVKWAPPWPRVTRQRINGTKILLSIYLIVKVMIFREIKDFTWSIYCVFRNQGAQGYIQFSYLFVVNVNVWGGREGVGKWSTFYQTFFVSKKPCLFLQKIHNWIQFSFHIAWH